jgi:flavin-dependent dehydrogenase
VVKSFDLVVVGAGPAGTAAALTGAELSRVEVEGRRQVALLADVGYLDAPLAF